MQEWDSKWLTLKSDFLFLSTGINIGWSKLEIELHTNSPHQTPKIALWFRCDGIQQDFKMKSVDQNVQSGSK